MKPIPRRRLVACLIALIALVAALGCSSGPPHQKAAEEGSPGAAVQAFYGLLDDGDYSGALALYSTEARQIVADPEVFRTWADQTTHQGTVDGVEIVDTQIDGSNATVQFEVAYEDGTKQAYTVGLVDEGGDWRLGMIAQQ